MQRNKSSYLENTFVNPLSTLLLQQKSLEPQDIQQKLHEIKLISEQDHLSDHLLLILKQISLLLETLPELMNLKTALLAQDIK